MLHAVADAFSWTLRAAWTAVRLALLTVLSVLEAPAQTVLGGGAFLIVLLALFFEYVAPPNHFPFWTALAVSAGCFLALVLHQFLIRVLSR